MVVPFVVFAMAAVLMPDATGQWTAKEGPVEHVSHGVLLLAVLAWSARTVEVLRKPGGGDPHAQGTANGVWLPLGVALWMAVVLAEELDWGAVYGFNGLAGQLSRVAGRPDLHNAWSGASYLVFCIPVLVLAGLGLVGTKQGAQPNGVALDRSDAAALIVVMAVSFVGTLAWSAVEAQLDEVAELVLYGVLFWIAARPRPREGLGRCDRQPAVRKEISP